MITKVEMWGHELFSNVANSQLIPVLKYCIYFGKYWFFSCKCKPEICMKMGNDKNLQVICKGSLHAFFGNYFYSWGN